MEPGIPKRITPGALAVRRAGDRYKKRIAGVVLEALRRGQQEVDVKALAKGFEERSQARIEMATNVALARADEVLKAKVPDLIFTTMAKGGEAELTHGFNRSGKPFRAAKQVLAFDYQFPQAISWAQTKSSAMIVGISNETRAAIRELVGRAWQEGWPPNHAAQMIRSQVGLHPQYARAVENLRTRMINSPGKTIKAGKTRISIPKSGASQALIEKRCSQYASRLLNKRAVLIARTETVAAANAGQRMAWLQAQEKGLLGKEEKREWLTTPEPCPQCGPLNGEVTSMDKPFPSGYWEPPAHPGCKCSQSISKRMIEGKKVKVPKNFDKSIKPFGNDPLFTGPMRHPGAEFLHDPDAAKAIRDQFTRVGKEFKKRGINVSFPVRSLLNHLTPEGRARIQCIKTTLDGVARATDIMAARGSLLDSKRKTLLNWYNESGNIASGPMKGANVAARGGFGGVQYNLECPSNIVATVDMNGLSEAARVWMHEYGHVGHSQVFPGAVYRNPLASELWREAKFASDENYLWRVAANRVGKSVDSMKVLARKVSRYATTNPLEFVAETFGNVQAGQVYSDEVLALYRKFGGQYLGQTTNASVSLTSSPFNEVPLVKPRPPKPGALPIPPGDQIIPKVLEFRNEYAMSHEHIAKEMGWPSTTGPKRVWNILKKYGGE